MRCCFDFPVCRSHVRWWMNASPLDAAKMMTPVSCVGRSGVRWAEERGLPPGQYVDAGFKVGGGANLVHVIVSAEEAHVLADLYEGQGCDGAANMLRRSVGIVGKQAPLFDDSQLALGGVA